jgi:multiple sugar transport system substrate-binding protein
MELSRQEFLQKGGLLTAAVALGAPLMSGCGLGGAGGGKTTLKFASAKFYGTSTMPQIVEDFNTSQSKIRVEYQELPPPSSSTEVHQQLVTSLGSASGIPDVFTQDVIWIAEFAGAGWSEPLDSYFDDKEKSEYFPGVIEACTWDGKLVALPWFVDTGMLYYRKDLLEGAGFQPPETWENLVDQAAKLMSDGKTRLGFLWQGKQAEVLVCDLVEYVASNGGSILGPDGKSVTIAEPPAREAVQFMRDLIFQYEVSPQDVLSWDEEPSRRPFTAGQAAFLRNWSYVYNVAQDPKESNVVDKVGVSPLPHFPGGKSAAALGGYQFGINASSQNKEAAVEFLRWLSSPETQLRFATEMGLAPSRPAVYEERKLREANPFMAAELKDVFSFAVPRPVTPDYPKITLVLQSQTSQALANGDVDARLSAAKEEIERIISS